MAVKQLDCTLAAGEHQKSWFAQLRKDVFEKQRPYAIVQADMPFELFHVMDVPVVSNQWWAAIISAKRLSAYYLDILNSLGFHEELCRYCSLAAASTLAKDPDPAPWGGLPKPALLCARLTCDCLQRVLGIWAEAFGSEFVFIDNPGATESPPRWWEYSRYCWRELFEDHRLKLTVIQLQNLIKVLERITGGPFQLDRLRDLMERVNRQEEYFEEAYQLICSAPKTPVQLHNPPWANEWIVYQARKHRIDAALVLTPLGTKPAATGNRFIERALEETGIPVLPIVADMVDARGWNPKDMRRKVSEFLTLRVLPRRTWQ
jgi:benzoyl-CoA reductase subunit B